MKRQFVKVVFLLITFSLVLGGTALASPKIGFFDMGRVLADSKEGRRSSDQFRRESESVKAQVDKKAQEFTTAREDFEKRQGVMDEATRGRQIEELRKLQAETEKLLMESNARLNKLSGDLTGPLVDKIFEVVRKIGQDGKYDFIFEREKAGIIHVNEKENLTERIIKELDRM